MKRILLILCISLWTLPSIAAAHATPVSSSPGSSSRIAEAPAEISILFSERLDEGASNIIVKGPDGSTVSQGRARVDDSDPRHLTVPLGAAQDGAYIVSWSVVSSDDGHFTRGSFPFAVGSAALPDMSGTDFEIVQIATTREAIAMTVELFGNGLIWASILIFAFGVRSVLRNGANPHLREEFAKGYSAVLLSGSVLALFGAAAQMVVKADDLAQLQGTAFFDALLAYVSTTAGSATAVRMLAISLVTLIYLLARRSITASARFTRYEGLMLLGMSVFAYYRALVSHATANPFFPELSVAVNFVHLIEKDFWAGAALILVLLLVFKRFKSVFEPVMQRIFTMLSVNLMLVALTASYIVWLHLKAFENLFTTQWGVVFMQLLIAAVVLVGARTYHILFRLYRPALFSRFLPLTLGVEAALALLVVLYSSAVIITSPPLPNTFGPVYRTTDEGISIDLRASAIEDDIAVLALAGGKTGEPIVSISGEGIDPISVLPENMFDGGYWFPLSFIDADETRTVAIRVSQEGGYDANARFTVPANVFKLAVEEDKRTVDMFTTIMLGIAFLGFLYAFSLYRLTRNAAVVPPVDRFAFPSIFALAGYLCALFVVVGMASAYSTSPFANSFKARCEADGNMWHLMLPMRAGVPLSETPREGCMWGMGNYQYMFADAREYSHYSTLPEARVALDFASDEIRAGVPQEFTVSVSYEDGAPATLFVDMEKLLHTVIVSRDQTVFAHVHPDDARELTPEEIETSTFNFSYIFPKAGDYLVSVDYANGLRLESEQFPVHVGGAPAQESAEATYEEVQAVGGFTVSLDTSPLVAGEVSTLYYDIRKDGVPAVLQPYLSAAMHIAVVKNDLGAFSHTHGEVHPPGTSARAPVVRDGRIVHSMAAMYTPPKFAPPVDAHVIFPEPGLYTVWGQFRADGEVHVVPFTLRVEE